MIIQENTIIHGDSLTVLRQMEPESVDAIITDPPYGINYVSQTGASIKNDKSPFIWFLYDAFRVLKSGEAGRGGLICFTRWDVEQTFIDAMKIAGFNVKSEVIWDKVYHGMGDTKAAFAPSHENIVFAVKGKYSFPGMIYVEDELIKLNGVVLPGLVKSIEVIETAKVDEQEVEGSATKPKQATGYEDAKVNIELIIDDTPSQTKYQRYATLRAVFRSPGQSVPQPIPIISEDTAAHGVEKVIFKKLSHKGENKRGQLTATLELWEYIPQTITAKSGSSSGSGKSGGGAASNLKAGYKSYLSNERGKSPARDDADATAAMNKVTAMPY